MYKYEYVSFKTKGVLAKRTEGYQDIINRYAGNGWRFVGIMPKEIDRLVAGTCDSVDLIFEKECIMPDIKGR